MASCSAGLRCSWARRLNSSARGASSACGWSLLHDVRDNGLLGAISVTCEGASLRDAGIRRRTSVANLSRWKRQDLEAPDFQARKVTRNRWTNNMTGVPNLEAAVYKVVQSRKPVRKSVP